MSRTVCGSPNKDGKPCELQKGHTGMHGCLISSVIAMYGITTTAYRAGHYWRMWKVVK